MANDYTDWFDLNGVEVHIQDYGRDQPNGVPVLDANGELPTKYLSKSYADFLKVSPEDPYDMSVTEWVASLNSAEYKNKGKSWTQGTGDNTNLTMQYLVYANGLWFCGSNSHGIWSSGVPVYEPKLEVA